MISYRRAAAIAALISCGSLMGCTSEEQRARKILEADAAGILACVDLSKKADAALQATADAMLAGQWSSAEALQAQAHPATTEFRDCMDREKLAIAQRLKDGGISDAVAARVSDEWWETDIRPQFETVPTSPTVP